MTLWDLLFRWIGRQWRRWNNRRPIMRAWPYWTSPPRFNIVQRYLMRRAVVVMVLIALFKINPFHPVSILATILGTTLVLTEHRVHRQQEEALYGKRKRG